MRPPHPPCLSTHWRDQQLAEPRVRSSCNSFKYARVALPSRGELIDISNGLLDAGAGHLLAECGRNGTPTESTGLVPASACNEGGRLATGKRHKLIWAANIRKPRSAQTPSPQRARVWHLWTKAIDYGSVVLEGLGDAIRAGEDLQKFIEYANDRAD
jgi:hypothetical protein